MGRRAVSALERHLVPSLTMLRRVVERCPDDALWLDDSGDYPLWQQVYHAVFFVDFWLREDYTTPGWQTRTFDKSLEVDLGKPSGDHLGRAEMLEYIDCVTEKVRRYCAALDDSRLDQPITSRSELAYIDALLLQVRHVMYHVGNCNRMLKQAGAATAGWLGPFEAETE